MKFGGFENAYKTSIFADAQRGILKLSIIHRGPSNLFFRGPGNRWDFDEKNMKNWAEHIGKKDNNSNLDLHYYM